MLARSHQPSAISDQLKLGIVVRKKGKTYKDRVCYVCGCEHWHRENMCVSCRNAEQLKRHGYRYIKRHESAGEIQRRVRLAEHTKRIIRKMKAIETVGLSPINSSIKEILDAGIELEYLDLTNFGKVAIDKTWHITDEHRN